VIDRLLAWLERRRRFREALEFNTANTFLWSKPGRWMCPCCCRIHRESGEVSKFSGPKFPACCDHPAGGRIGKQFATPF
jgi:hypothetical protein